MTRQHDTNGQDTDAINDETLAVSDQFDAPSRSQLKREAEAIRDLGQSLTLLSDRQRADLPLPDEVRSALDALLRIKSHGARKRQLGFLARQLRQIDVEPIVAAVDAIQLRDRRQADQHHLVEAWRDRLLGLTEESSADALTAFLNQQPGVDRQQLRQLQKKSITDQQSGKPPAAARQLFRLIRDALLDGAA